jgi:hypothetical protein
MLLLRRFLDKHLPQHTGMDPRRNSRMVRILFGPIFDHRGKPDRILHRYIISKSEGAM